MRPEATFTDKNPSRKMDKNDIRPITGAAAAMKACEPLMQEEERLCVLVCNHANEPIHAFSLEPGGGPSADAAKVVERLNITGLAGGEALVAIHHRPGFFMNKCQPFFMRDIEPDMELCKCLKKELEAFPALLLDCIVSNRKEYYSFYDQKLYQLPLDR